MTPADTMRLRSILAEGTEGADRAPSRPPTDRPRAKPNRDKRGRGGRRHTPYAPQFTPTPPLRPIPVRGRKVPTLPTLDEYDHGRGWGQ